jgi:hypothetical protein
MDINTALPEVLEMALTHGSLAHGLHEAAKALDKYVKPDYEMYETSIWLFLIRTTLDVGPLGMRPGK